MVFELCIFVVVLGGGVWWWRVWNERRRMEALPEKDRSLVELMRRGATAMKHGDAEAQGEVLRAIGELGTGASVAFIADWLATKSVSLTWPDLLKGIVEGAENAEPQWKDGVFRALEQGLADPSTPNFFHSWPFVSWPAAMMAVDGERAVKVFAERKLLVLGEPGFSAAVSAINESASAVVPADIAAHWLPATMPDLKQQGVGDEYLLMVRAHAEHDLPEAQRRLWEMVNEGGKLGEEAALLLLKAEGLPDPVWKLDSRVQEVGLDQVRPAERTVWTVANWFTFPINTSGFSRYAESSEADHLHEVIEGLQEIGATLTAHCLKEWAGMFGPEWPANQYDREAMIDERMLKPAENWSAICSRTGNSENVILLNLKHELIHADQFEREKA